MSQPDKMEDGMQVETTAPVGSPEFVDVELGLQTLAQACDTAEGADEDGAGDEMARDQEVHSRLQILQGWFAAELKQTPFEKLGQLWDELDRRVRSMEEEFGAEAIPDGVVGEFALLDTLLEVAAICNKSLGQRHRVKPPYAMDLAIGLVQNMFKKAWGSSILHVMNMDLYLEPGSVAANFNSMLPDRVAEELYSRARERLAEVEHTIANTSDEQATPELAESLLSEQEHMIQVLLGKHAPFNSSIHSRWRSVDLYQLFLPTTDSWVLTPEQTRFAVQISRGLLADEEPSRSPDNWVPAAKAKSFLETGTLPSPWKAHPSFFQVVNMSEQDQREVERYQGQQTRPEVDESMAV